MFLKYPKIVQLKEMMNKVKKYHPEVKEVQLNGFVKIHGTNAAIVVTEEGEVEAQSRSRTLTLDQDNAGFCAFITGHEAWLKETLSPLAGDEELTIFGEWCGGNIQKGVAVNGMPTHFIVFDVVVDGVYQNPSAITAVVEAIDLPNVKSILDFGSYQSSTFTIYTQMDELIAYTQEKTLEVEENCPVGAELNPESESTIGEGVVWSIIGLPEIGKFKTKGTKHERTGKGKRVVKVEEVNPEKSAALEEFYSLVLTEDRLNQGIEVLKEQLVDTSTTKSTGQYIKWICKDILEEHSEDIASLAKFDILWKNLSSTVASTARNFYMSQL